MKNIPVICRRYRGGAHEALLIFPWDDAGGGLWSCYQHTGQHGAIARDYYRTQTVPANPADPDMAALLREYDQLGAASDRIPLRVLKRAPAWSARHV